MKIRGEINAVSEGPDGGHALLAAFLEATGKIDRRALQKRGALISHAPMAVNLEALPTLLEAHSTLLEANPTLVESNLTALDVDPPVLEVVSASLDASPTLLEASPASTAPKSQIAPFAFRRANLVRA